MKKITVYQGSMVYSEHEEWPKAHTLPDASYIQDRRTKETSWYIVRFGQAMPINLSDIPATIRMLMLVYKD